MLETYCCGTKVEKGSWQGEPSIKFCSGGYEAVMLPGVGANVVSLRNIDLDCDILRSPEEVNAFRGFPVVYGIPILFPPNRIEDGIFEAAGRKYVFPINEESRNNHCHGFLFYQKWETTRMEILPDGAAEVEVTFVADDSTDFYQYFPHEFKITIINRLSSEGLRQEITIENNSSSPMPMGFGFHTVFNFPFRKDSTKEDYRLIVSAGKLWELNDRMLPTGRLLTPYERYIPIRKEGINPGEFPMDGHFTAEPLHIGASEFHGAILRDTSKNIDLVYEVGEGFKHWMIWNADGNQGFVCPEPQTWAVNAPNIKLPPEVTGLYIIEPGKKWNDYCKIMVMKTEEV
ncbi:MAG TPA: aldose 1-epimerase [Clostridiaceae bacterium]|nr:aldose 1-epimerase [Clostridiaceae bacterium]